jgi:hypothetical protein
MSGDGLPEVRENPVDDAPVRLLHRRPRGVKGAARRNALRAQRLTSRCCPPSVGRRLNGSGIHPAPKREDQVGVWRTVRGSTIVRR